MFSPVESTHCILFWKFRHAKLRCFCWLQLGKMWVFNCACYWLFLTVAFAVGCVVSRTVIQLLTCNLSTCVLNWCRRLNMLLKWPDVTLQLSWSWTPHGFWTCSFSCLLWAYSFYQLNYWRSMYFIYLMLDFQDGVEAGAVEGAEVRQVATARQDLIHMLMQ